MTCIIGLVDAKQVYIAGDSAAAVAWSMSQVKQRKVFRTGEFLIGYTDSFRMGQLLQFGLEVSEQSREQGNYAYMVSVFAETVRDLFKSQGFLWTDHERQSGGRFLVGYRSNLYEVQSDFSVLQYLDNYLAVGCGAVYALGAMYANSDLPPKKRLRQALKAADHFSNGVSAPFYIEKL